jgi:cytochrome P450
MVTTQSQPSIDYEPYSHDSRRRQFELYKELRDKAPVFHTESDWWCISRYDDIREVLLSPDRFSASIVQDEAFGLPTEFDPNMDPEKLQMLLAVVSGMPVDIGELLTGRVIVAADPPDHTRMRRIVNRGFTPKRIADLRPSIEAIVAECLAGIETAHEYEVIQQLAIPLPVRVIGELLSVDADDVGKIKEWSDIVMAASSGTLRGTTEGQAMLLEMFKEFANYFVPRIEARRAEPRDDLISDLVRAEEEEKFSATEAVMFLLSVMVAGNESTTSTVGNAVVALKENPDQLKLLIDNPDLARAAVQESLRLLAPFQFYWRKATGDTEIAGRAIPAGARILVIVGSANTDPRAFKDPDRFDILRQGDPPNLTFGLGHHHCLGMHLGILEAEVAIRELVPHLDRFSLSDEELTFPDSFIVYGYERVLLRAG